MSTEKMDSLAVYALFEELKQKIVELGNKQTQNVQAGSAINSAEISPLVEEIRKLASQKQFTPEQIKELEEEMAGFTSHALKKSFEKWDKGFSAVTNLIHQIDEKIKTLNVPQDFVIRKEYVFCLDFKNSKAAITLISMGLIILLSLAGNIWQSARNNQLKDNDLKYRYVKMRGEANSESLLRLEDVFTYNRDKDSISVIRIRVETYERLIKEQAEKIERARMNAKEADRLQKEVENVKSNK